MKNLQSQISRYNRAQWIMAVAMVVLVTGFYWTGYRPGMMKLSDLRIRIDAKERELDANQSRARTLPVVVMEVEKLRRRLDRFDKQLPRQPDLGQFIKEVTQLSQQSSLRKLTVEPGKPIAAEQFLEMPITLSFEGTFPDVVRFLRQAEEMQRMTRVRNVSFRTVDAARGAVEVKMAMNIYFAQG